MPLVASDCKIGSLYPPTGRSATAFEGLRCKVGQWHAARDEDMHPASGSSAAPQHPCRWVGTCFTFHFTHTNSVSKIKTLDLLKYQKYWQKSLSQTLSQSSTKQCDIRLITQLQTNRECGSYQKKKQVNNIGVCLADYKMKLHDLNR